MVRCLQLFPGSVAPRADAWRADPVSPRHCVSTSPRPSLPAVAGVSASLHPPAAAGPRYAAWSAVLLCLAPLIAVAEEPLATQPSATGILRIATCQFPVGGDVKENAEWIRRQMREAREKGADIAHFCESALPGYAGADHRNLNGFDWDLLHRETESILALARELRLWVVLGSMHRLTGDHKPHNCVYVIDPEGRIVDRYDKRFCTRGDLRHYSPGDHFAPFEVNGIRCGVLICYDLGFPELYRQYCKLGTQVMFHSFYNARDKRWTGERSDMASVLGRAHAAMNDMHISLCNTCGPMSWPSCFVANDGLLGGRLEAETPGVLISVVDANARRNDSTRPFRLQAIDGKLNSGTPVDDPRSRDRTGY